MNSNFVTLTGWAFAAFFAVSTAVCVFVLKGESDANKALPHVFVCFDGQGHPTHDQFFSECKDVQYRVPHGR